MTHVLIVDDHEPNLYLLDAILSARGYRVTKARHGAEALVLARQERPDLVVSDLLMPVMDGYTLLRHWKADPALRERPFVVYTATYTEAEDEQLALDMGADEFILKSAEPEEFLDRISAVLEQRVERLTAIAVPAEDEAAVLRLYSTTLIRKLEEKSLLLEEANQRLRRELVERQRAEALQRIARHAARMGAWSFDIAAQRLTWTEEVAAIHGEPQGWTPTVERGISYYVPEHRDRITAAFTACITDGTPFDVELQILTARGERRWVRAIGEAQRDEQGTITHAQGALQDIHEQKLAESRLREQAALLDKAQDAILVRDLDHRVTFWNRSAERLYGWTAEEAIGRSIVELIYSHVSDFTTPNNATMAQGEWIGEVHQLTKDGRSVTVEGRWTVVRDDAGRPIGVLAINTDIARRKALEQQVFRAQRLESIGTLAGGIAHDLNNILAPIIMAVDLLETTIVDPESRETLRLIGQTAHRGAGLVKQVLSFARGLEGRRLTCHLLPSVLEVVAITSETFPKNIEVVTDVADDLWLLDADPTQLHQVLLNLCVNARDAMPRGGRITITASNIAIDEPYAAMNVEARPGPYVRIEVQDQGTGIPADIIDKVFDPFFTTKAVGKGTGLGLATTLAIVQAHNGFIRVYSEPDVGTRFRVYLPASAEVIASAETLSTADLPAGEGEVILVVDDEAPIRQITKQTLEAYGYRVLLAADGSEAVALFVMHRDEIAAVLTDMMMPVMDGPAMIRVLRRLPSDVPVIAASGINDTSRTAADDDLGVVAFLAKPFTAATLLTAVRNAVAARESAR